MLCDNINRGNEDLSLCDFSLSWYKVIKMTEWLQCSSGWGVFISLPLGWTATANKCDNINCDEVGSISGLDKQDQILVAATNVASGSGEDANHIYHSCCW